MGLIFLLLFGGIAQAFATSPQSAVVVVPVADVWSRPSNPGEKPGDDLRETQVLFGEKVIIHESSGPWVHIEAVEQPEFTHNNRWEGYPGWVRGDSIDQTSHTVANAMVSSLWLNVIQTTAGPDVALPIGARVQVLDSPLTRVRLRGEMSEYVKQADLVSLPLSQPQPALREKIWRTAQLFVGVPYLWGGFSPMAPGSSPFALPGAVESVSKYGIDCSGLVHLAYRVNGISVPRDSHEQWMKAKPIRRTELKPADLIFSAKADNPKKITHVALYEGNGQIVEAPQAGMVVRKISFKEKYGKDFEKVESGDKVGDRVIYFGSFLQK